MEGDPTSLIRSRRLLSCSVRQLAPLALLIILGGAFAAVHYPISPSQVQQQQRGGRDPATFGSITSNASWEQYEGGSDDGEVRNPDDDGDPPAAASWNSHRPLEDDDNVDADDGDAAGAQQQQQQQQQSSSSIAGKPRVAICLVGGARAFELTGPTIRKYVVDVYPHAHVFLHSPLDKDSHKFTVLKGAKNLAAARIFIPRAIPTSKAPKGLLTASNSPNGLQGLLQYFSLVEGCLSMIREHEVVHNVSYEWVVRTRVDTFWNAPIPPLSSFPADAYTVPYGSQFGGLNDRFGAGTRRTSEAALARLSLLPRLHSAGYGHLNSETAFKMQLVVCNVSYELRRLPFCVLSRRKYAWPPSQHGVPVASILSGGPLNGAKCRPCTPELGGAAAQRLADRLSETLGGIGPVDDLRLCNATQGWGPEWPDVYKRAVPARLRSMSSSASSKSLDACIRRVEAFKGDWGSWEAPPSAEICAAAGLSR